MHPDSSLAEEHRKLLDEFLSGAAANAKRAETLGIELSQERQASAALKEKMEHLNMQLIQSRSALEQAQQQCSKQRDTELANLQLLEQTGELHAMPGCQTLRKTRWRST